MSNIIDTQLDAQGCLLGQHAGDTVTEPIESSRPEAVSSNEKRRSNFAKRRLCLMSLADAARILGISRVRAYQLEQSAFRKLRQHPLIIGLKVEINLRS